MPSSLFLLARLSRPRGRVPFLALMLVLPLALMSGSAQAAPPPPPTVTLALGNQPTAETAASGGGCFVVLQASWQAGEVHGAYVDTRLYEEVEGTRELVGAGFHVPDTGLAEFRLHDVQANPHRYVFELVRGGQERVLASDSLDVGVVSC